LGELVGVVGDVAGGGEEEDALVGAEELLEVAAEVVGRLALGEEGDERAAAHVEQVGQHEGREGADGALEAEGGAGAEPGHLLAGAAEEGEGGEAMAEVLERHGRQQTTRGAARCAPARGGVRGATEAGAGSGLSWTPCRWCRPGDRL